ncbi:MAG TPA: chemotaxis protein CheA [Verrucomicrobiae bacterium]|nr:chemotaxis protein CheA [Verrucomicrobiae bacterium]
MNSELPAGLNAEMLDDFYVECDEQLTAIRENLVRLEESVGMAEADAEAVERLFRSFHSFKGNAAIVGLRAAENLSHAAEDFIRELSAGKVILRTESLDLLMASAQRLEEIVAGQRASKPIPEIGPLLASLHQLAGKSDDTPPVPTAAPVNAVKPDLLARAEQARARGLSVWRFTFAPSQGLDQRGVNVGWIRSRISGLGEILDGIPQVHPGGTISFDFVVALAETPADLSAWENDGVRIAPFYASPSAHVKTVQDTHTPQSAAAAGPFVAPSHVVRVDLSKLDELMRITGEMVIHRARLEDQLQRLSRENPGADTRGLQEATNAMARDLRELREGIMRVRLVPAAEIFARLPFVVRDLARDSGKQVRLTLSGQQTELDKYVVERLKDPLLHLVRNSVSHGIEPPAMRVASGKPAEATIFLRASTLGDSVMIEVGDDGRGVDLEAVRRRAAERGLPAPENLNGNALLKLLTMPGFSTRDEADRSAGRGVGMAVVQKIVRELGGILALETRPGEGVHFKLRLPLTLAIADVFLITVGAQTCALPHSYVREVLRLDPSTIRRVNETEVIPYRDGILPLVRLRSLFAMEAQPGSEVILVLNSERGSAGLVVSRILGQREVVVRPLRDPLIQVAGVAGATELGDGRPVLILDAAALTGGIVRPNEDDADAATARTVAIAI